MYEDLKYLSSHVFPIIRNLRDYVCPKPVYSEIQYKSYEDKKVLTTIFSKISEIESKINDIVGEDITQTLPLLAMNELTYLEQITKGYSGEIIVYHPENNSIYITEMDKDFLQEQIKPYIKTLDEILTRLESKRKKTEPYPIYVSKDSASNINYCKRIEAEFKNKIAYHNYDGTSESQLISHLGWGELSFSISHQLGINRRFYSLVQKLKMYDKHTSSITNASFENIFSQYQSVIRFLDAQAQHNIGFKGRFNNNFTGKFHVINIKCKYYMCKFSRWSTDDFAFINTLRDYVMYM